MYREREHLPPELGAKYFIVSFFYWILTIIFIGFVINNMLWFNEQAHFNDPVWCVVNNTNIENRSIVLVIGDINSWIDLERISQRDDIIFMEHNRSSFDVCVFNHLHNGSRISNLKNVLAPYENKTIIITENSYGEHLLNEYLDLQTDTSGITIITMPDITQKVSKSLPINRSKIIFSAFWLARSGIMRILSVLRGSYLFLQKRVAFANIISDRMYKLVQSNRHGQALYDLLRLITPKFGRDMTMNYASYWEELQNQDKLTTKHKVYVRHASVNYVQFEEKL